MWHRLVDFSVPGRTPATSLLFQRTYLETPLLMHGDFGPHWFDNWETQLIAQNSGTATPNFVWIDTNGGGWVFTRNPDNSFKNPPGFVGTLTEFSDHYTLVQKQGITLTFSRNAAVAPIGRLTSLSEPHGESVALTYDSSGNLTSLSTALAGSVTITRDSQNRITGLTRVRDSLSYSYTYNSNGSLATSADFEGNTYQYGYLTQPSTPSINGLLTTITDPLLRVISFSYDSTGHATSQTEPGNATRSFVYSTAPGTGLPVTTVTEIDGGVSTYYFDAQFRLIQTTLPDGSNRFQQWDAQNNIVQQTDELGFKALLGYDARNNLISIQKPLDPSPTTIAYNQSFDVPTLVTPLVGAPTQFQINPTTGDVVGTSRTSGTTTLSLAMTRDAFGNLLSVNNGLSTYANQTDANGLKTLVFDARNPETLTYDSHARISTQTFKSGRVLSYQYDNHDRITRIDDTAGPSVVNQYDVINRLLSRTIVSQDGTISEKSQYTWDVRDRLSTTTNALNQVSELFYDPVNADGSVRVIDQPIRAVDALGHATLSSYDSRLRLVKRTDANGGVTQYGYNARGDLTSLIDPSNNQNTFLFDGNGRLSQSTRASLAQEKGKAAAAQEISTYLYDLTGRLTSRIDISVRDANGGRKIAWTYDGFDRLSEKVESKTLDGKTTIQDDSTYTYQPELDATLLATANNEHEKLSFQSESLPPFAMTSYSTQATDAKNPLGLIQDMVTITPGVTAPIAVLNSKAMGKLLSETSDPAGRLTQLVGTLSRATLTSTVGYDSLFRRRSIVDAASAPGQKSTALIGSFSYDLLNRATSTYWDGNSDEFFNGHFSESLSYDAASNVTQSTRELGTLKYAYDAINELTGSSFQSQDHHNWDLFTPALNRTWKYDLTGNRIQDSLRGTGDFIANGIVSDKIDDFKSDPDGFGNVVGIESRDGGLTEKLGYRADGKLTHFEAGWEHGWFFGSVDKFKTRYLYDALGRRIAKEHGFVDEHDHSLCDLRHGIHHHEHALTISYSYLGNQDKVLLARDAGNEISLYLDGDQGMDDHLGEIRHGRARGYVKDHLGSVMNSAASGGVALFGSFGEMVGFAPSLALVSEPALYGFAGRQLDPESGLYYMRARMYSPVIGRFLTTDPIGFWGGDYNLYRYAGNSPLTYTDPSGQISVVWGAIAVVAAAGIAIYFLYDSINSSQGAIIIENGDLSFLEPNGPNACR